MQKTNSKEEILNLLKMVKSGTISPEDAVLRLQIAPFKDLEFANCGFLSLIVFCGASAAANANAQASVQINTASADFFIFPP
jgi:hypothetical protein